MYIFTDHDWQKLALARQWPRDMRPATLRVAPLDDTRYRGQLPSEAALRWCSWCQREVRESRKGRGDI